MDGWVGGWVGGWWVGRLVGGWVGLGGGWMGVWVCGWVGGGTATQPDLPLRVHDSTFEAAPHQPHRSEDPLQRRSFEG